MTYGFSFYMCPERKFLASKINTKMADNTADVDGRRFDNNNALLSDENRKYTGNHLSHVHATHCLGIVGRSDRCHYLAPDLYHQCSEGGIVFSSVCL